MIYLEDFNKQLFYFNRLSNMRNSGRFVIFAKLIMKKKKKEEAKVVFHHFHVLFFASSV